MQIAEYILMTWAPIFILSGLICSFIEDESPFNLGSWIYALVATITIPGLLFISLFELGKLIKYLN
jgi:hypothetical protein